MAYELASAYVTIMPSLAGAGKQIAAELGGIDVSSAGKKIGSSLGSMISSGLGSMAKVGATVAATVGGAVTAIAAKGGIDRALSIENAQAKLKGLGKDTQTVQAIMDSALASVKGTAYGLGDAASVAAGLSAAGIQSGTEMISVLTTVADVAAISGRSLTDVGTIFNSVAARGKLQGDDMLQLMSSGVPVLQLLGDHLGKTSAEVSNMVSKGQIGFQAFADAMQEGLGGSALASGETFIGALANIRSALGRLGASVATPALSALQGIFSGLIPVVDQVTAAIQPLVDAFASKLADAVPVVVAWFQSLADKISELSSGGIGQFGSVLAGLAPLVMAFLAPLLSNLPIIGGLLSGITPAFGGIVGMFAAMVASSPALQSALGGLIGSVAELVQSILPSLTPLLGMAVGALQVAGNVLAAIIGPVSAILGWLSGAGDLLGALAVAVLAGVTAWKAWNAAIALWQGIVKVGTAIQVVFNAVMSANPIMLVVIAIAALVAGLVWFFTQTETGKEIWASFTAALQSAWQATVDFFVWAGQQIAAGFQASIDWIVNAWNGTVAWFQGLPGQIAGFFASLGDWIATPFRNAGAWARQTFQGVVDWFRQVPGWIGGFFSGVGAMISQPFRTAFNWIRNAWNSTVGGFGFTVPDWIPGVGGRSFSIPRLADGATIQPKRGGTLALLAEAGRAETVVDTGKMNALLDMVLNGGVQTSSEAKITVNTNDPMLAATVIAEKLRRA